MAAKGRPEMRNQFAQFDVGLINATFDAFHLLPDCRLAVLSQCVVQNADLKFKTGECLCQRVM